MVWHGGTVARWSCNNKDCDGLNDGLRRRAVGQHDATRLTIRTGVSFTVVGYYVG